MPAALAAPVLRTLFIYFRFLAASTGLRSVFMQTVADAVPAFA